MPEKKMLKKSNLFKTKRTSQQNGRTKSVNKKDSCKTFLSPSGDLGIGLV